MSRFDYSAPMKVPEECYEAYRLHTLGWPVSEIARELGIDEEDAHEHIVRVWKNDKIRKVLR